MSYRVNQIRQVVLAVLPLAIIALAAIAQRRWGA